MVIEQEAFINSVYTIILKLKTYKDSSRFYNVFNGRYFQDDATINNLEQFK